MELGPLLLDQRESIGQRRNVKASANNGGCAAGGVARTSSVDLLASVSRNIDCSNNYSSLPADVVAVVAARKQSQKQNTAS